MGVVGGVHSIVVVPENDSNDISCYCNAYYQTERRGRRATHTLPSCTTPPLPLPPRTHPHPHPHPLPRMPSTTTARYTTLLLLYAAYVLGERSYRARCVARAVRRFEAASWLCLHTLFATSIRLAVLFVFFACQVCLADVVYSMNVVARTTALRRAFVPVLWCCSVAVAGVTHPVDCVLRAFVIGHYSQHLLCGGVTCCITRAGFVFVPRPRPNMPPSLPCSILPAPWL